MPSPSSDVAASPAPSPAADQKRILVYWLPLAASWLLMASEMPFVNGALARLSEAERMIAAFGIVTTLSITIESPVIALLSTSTTLSRTRQNYRMVRRFTTHLMAGTTVLHFLLGWTPLFNLVVVRWLGVPESLIEPSRLGLRIMLFWSAAIAWRRFNQGVLIRFGRTRYVGQGTIVRLLASAGTAILLALFSDLPGVAVGTLALSAGVTMEAGYAHWAGRDLIAEKFAPGVAQPELPDLGYAELVKFHWPLAASNLLFLFTRPLVSAALARSPHPETALAAWPVVSGLLFQSRAPALALPEVIIALSEEEDRRSLSRFSLRVGASFTLLLAIISFTPLSRLYFHDLIGVSERLTDIAVLGARVGLLLPLLMSLVSLNRGLLMTHRFTLPITAAMIAELTLMALTLAVGVLVGAPGVMLAAAAMTLSTAADLLILLGVSRRLTPT